MNVVDSLDPLVTNNGEEFLKDLRFHGLFVNLRNPVRGGHSVRFDVLNGGNVQDVADVATKHHITLNGDSLTFQVVAPKGFVLPASATAPPQVVEADDVSQAPLTVQPPAAGHAKTVQEADNEIKAKYHWLPLHEDQDRRKWFYDNNVAQASKMDPVGRLYVENLLNKLRNVDDQTVIQLMPPIRNGNAVRFLFLAGNLALVKSLAGECKLRVQGDLITVPHIYARLGQDHLQAEADYVKGTVDGHVSATLPTIQYPETGIPDKIVQPNTRTIVSTLPLKNMNNLDVAQGAATN